jgi:hypothetical protein
MSRTRRPLNILMSRLFRPRQMFLSLLLLLVIGAPLFLYGSSEAVLLSFRSLQLSDGTVGVTGAKYNFTFNTNTSGPLGSISFEVCSNYQYESTDPCTPPVGFDATGATLTGQTGISNFNMPTQPTGSKLLISRPVASNVTPQQLTVEFSNITNPTNVGSYYVRIQTYASTDGNGPETDYGIVVFATNDAITISTEVPPYLMFCTGITIDGFNCGTAAGSFISFGELSSKIPRTATSQLLASTNAPYGYSVTLAGSTMTAGTNVIPAMSGAASRPGTNQFGLNAKANSTPTVGSEPEGPGLTVPSNPYNTPNQFRFTAGDIIASSNNTDDYRKMTISYLVNVGANQPAGRYVATISYICLANF